MTSFTFGDIVRVKNEASQELRPDAKAWIVMVHAGPTRWGAYFETFPPGVVYSIEYEDGSSTEVHESLLEPWPTGDPS
ncbi:hypothetical protein [uncultured Parvibaculum sp.]|uniref:hypothetical protein n=1 Tax=uncultured Parvibaculum sp. TaxID=291828 RepID=UPI0030EEB1AD